MSYFGRSECGLFASKSLVAHIVRGMIAAVLITWALLHQLSNPAFAVAAGVVALVVMRGCFLCWTIGLLETVGHKIKARRSASSSYHR